MCANALTTVIYKILDIFKPQIQLYFVIVLYILRPSARPPLYKTLMTHSTNALVLNPDPLGRGILTQDYIPILISGAEQEG